MPDYVKTVPNDLGTHETCFVQTRSATKGEHGYRVINIKNGDISHTSQDTPTNFGHVDKSTFTLSLANFSGKPEIIWGISVIDSSNRHTGMIGATGKIKRKIPNSYYTGYYDKPPTVIPQVLTVYPSDKSLWAVFHSYESMEGLSDVTQESSTTSQGINFNFSIRHHTETEIVEYRYDNVGLTDDSKASVDLTSANPDHIMMIDDNGDGVADREEEPIIVSGCNYDHDGDGIVEDDIDDLIMANRCLSWIQYRH